MRVRVSNRARSTSRAILTVFVAAACAASVAGCASSHSGGGGGGSTPEMKLGVTPGVWYQAPAFVAEAKGMFKEHGLNVQLVNITGGSTVIAAAVSGSIDALSLSTDLVMQSSAKGQSFDMLTQTVPHVINGVPGLTSIIDACPEATQPYPKPILCMKGKRVGVTQLGSANYYLLLSLLKAAGMSKNDVKILPLGTASQMAVAMQHGQVDFFVGAEPGPTYADAIAGVAKPLIPLQDGSTDPLFTDWAGAGFFALSSRLESKAGDYTKLAAALNEATAWAANPANEDELATIFKKYSAAGQAQTIDQLVKAAPTTFGATISCQGVENVAKWLSSTGQAPADKLPATCRDFVWSGVQNNIKS